MQIDPDWLTDFRAGVGEEGVRDTAASVLGFHVDIQQRCKRVRGIVVNADT